MHEQIMYFRRNAMEAKESEKSSYSNILVVWESHTQHIAGLHHSETHRCCLDKYSSTDRLLCV